MDSAFDPSENTDDPHRLYDLACDVLEGKGPLSDEEWTKALEKVFKSKDIDPAYAESVVLDCVGPFQAWLADERTWLVEDIVADLRAAHRLTQFEIDHDVLAEGTDLMGLTSVFSRIPTIVPLPEVPATKEFMESRGFENLSLLDGSFYPLPQGTFKDKVAGDMISVGIKPGVGETADEMIVETAGPMSAPNLRPILDRFVPEDGTTQVDPLYWQIIHEYGTEPMLPLSDLITAAGFVCAGEVAAREGFDFEAQYQRKLELLKAHQDKVGQDDPLVNMLGRTIAAFARLCSLPSDRGVDSLPPEDYRTEIDDVVTKDPLAFEDLSDPSILFDCINILRNFADNEVVTDRETYLKRVRVAGTQLARFSTDSGAPGGLMISAAASLGLGEPAEAGETYRDLLRANPDWWPAEYGLAVLSLCRGDFEGALSRYRQVPEFLATHTTALLENITRPIDGPEPGRNDPCWCGSGRKYKVCHRGRPIISAYDRNYLLATAVQEYGRISGAEWRCDPVSDAYSEYMTEDVFRSMDGEAFPRDVSIIEGGLLGDFVEELGSSLDGEIAIVAHMWELTERSVFEVLEVVPGSSMVVRDMRTGEQTEITERAGTRSLRSGMLFCSRIVPEGDRHVLYGGIEAVTPTLADQLIELLDEDPVDPVAVAALIGSRFAPPEIVSADTGEEFGAFAAHFKLSGEVSIRRRLSRRYGKGADDEWTWLDGTRVLGYLTLKDDVLTITAMAESRYASLLDDVRDMDPGAQLMDEHATTADEMIQEALDSGVPVPDPAHDDEFAELMRNVIVKQEEKWIDEQIPALGGRTPRECVADPTRREDVVRLLATFPEYDGYEAFSPAHIRKLLELEE